jgi:hypothetical protein
MVSRRYGRWCMVSRRYGRWCMVSRMQLVKSNAAHWATSTSKFDSRAPINEIKLLYNLAYYLCSISCRH